MPIYEYRCLACNGVFSHLFQRHADAKAHESCPDCGSDQTQRVMSLFAVSGRAHPGPGRAAWPTSWEDTNGGDPETLRYWRHRIEREARLEEKYPELSDPALRNGSGTAADAPLGAGTETGADVHDQRVHQHNHDHHHEHHHSSGVSSGEAPHVHATGAEHGDSIARTP